MNRKSIDKAVKSALKDLKVTDLSDSDLGLDLIEDIARQGDALHAQVVSALTGKKPEAQIKKMLLFQTMAKGKFSAWFKALVEKEVKKLICGQVYERIDTEGERTKILDKYDDVIADAIIAAYPVLAIARPLIKLVVRFLLARGLALAAKDLCNYCAVTT